MTDSRTRRAAVRAPLVLAAAISLTAGGATAAGPVGAPTPDAGAVARSLVVELAAEARASGGAGAGSALSPRASAGAASGAAGLVASSHGQEQERARAAAPERPPIRVAAPEPNSLSGHDRLWIPSLGMSVPVHLFECIRNTYPDNLMYRWGCAGSNNVYIFGHAWGVMKPFHDLFEDGHLRAGLVAMYADADGRIRQYRVTEWRVVEPDEPDWAVASQPVPSMTLQTCVGERGELRLNVRLLADD